LQRHVQDGDLVIATAAVDATGYGRQVTPRGYPAVADWRLVQALVSAAGKRSHVTGIVLTNDHFYGGVETSETPHYPTMTAANVLAVEMECAALFKVGSLRKVQTAAILAVDGNVMDEGESMDAYDPHREIVNQAVEDEIEIALRALASTAEEEG
jgi:uridine phosphorylase